jgi:general secretion pathway protein D
MKKHFRSTSTFPPLSRMAAGALLCCALTGLVPSPAAWAAPEEQAAMNFVGADIESVIKAIGHYTGTTFIIDPRVKGTITVTSERPVSKSQAFNLLTSALRLQGYAVVSGEGFAKVVPEADAKLQPSPTRVGIGASTPRGDQVATQIYRLQHESAANLVAVLRPLISPNNSISAEPGSNSLVITDYADNLRRMTKIIASLDAPTGAELEVVPIKNAIASDIAPMVTRLMGTAPGGDAGPVTAVADPRTNSVVIRAPSRGRARAARELVSKLDQPTAQAGNVHVVFLKNADATRLAQTLRAVVSSDPSAMPQTQTGTQGGSVQTGGGAVSMSQGVTQGVGSGNTTSGNTFASQNPTQPTGGQGAGFIQADASTNTLIITAPEAIYRNLRQVIDLLDVRRAQVYIEALVVEVNAAKAAELGVQWVGLTGDSGSSYRVGGLTNFVGRGSGTGTSLVELVAAGSQANPGAGMALGVFRQSGGQLTLGAIAKALENNGNSNILSTPQIFTLDNELATIKVGQNVPIITGQFTTQSGTASNPFQTIDRKDVGLTLKVRPQISEGGTIKLAIYHESSNVVQSSVTATSGLTTDIRVIENNVIADDGQIIVLGGLIKDDSSDNVEKVPVLGDMPVVGGLFKYRNRARSKTNLMVFLRPVILRTAEDSAFIAADRYDYMRASGVAAQPQATAVLPNLGAPILPELTEGQPAPGGNMVALPPNAPSAPPQPARPGAAEPAKPPAPVR